MVKGNNLQAKLTAVVGAALLGSACLFAAVSPANASTWVANHVAHLPR